MCSGGWIGFQFTTESKNSRGKGTKLRSLILFLHYLPFKENSFLSYPFSFSFYLFITAHNGHSCTAREYFILHLKFLHQFSDSKTHDTSSESEKTLYISITKTTNQPEGQVTLDALYWNSPSHSLLHQRRPIPTHTI
jgi:hypothetical protein